MSDRLSKEQRSANMRAVKGRDTGPEKTVRRLAHGMGYRFRLHRADLPGNPDLAFPSRRAVIFVHGCFWHRHTCQRGVLSPKTNAEFWRSKLARNVARDRRVRRELTKLGWQSAVVWECQLKDIPSVKTRIARFLK